MRIRAIVVCVCGVSGATMASEINDETSIIGQSAMTVARDEHIKDLENAKIGVCNRRNIASAQLTEKGLAIRVQWERELTYKDIADAWVRNQSFVYTSLAAMSAIFFYHVRFHKT